jgi:octaprenyl-diphosphate synthase
VLAGDFFYARASSMIVEDGDLEILYIFANTIRSMAEGELLQLERSFDPEVTEAHYYAVIDHKSASLIAAATEAGAILGGVTRAERRRLREFGREFGTAFQLRDDALDYEAGEAELGKRAFADLREGKITLPLLLALKRCSAAERDAIASVLKSAARLAELAAAHAGSEPIADGVLDMAPVLDAIQRYHGVADTIRRAEVHRDRAIAAIAPFSAGRAKEDLLAAAHFTVARDR